MQKPFRFESAWSFHPSISLEGPSTNISYMTKTIVESCRCLNVKVSCFTPPLRTMRTWRSTCVRCAGESCEVAAAAAFKLETVPLAVTWVQVTYFLTSYSQPMRLMEFLWRAVPLRFRPRPGGRAGRGRRREGD